MIKKIALTVLILAVIAGGVYYFFFKPEEAEAPTYQTAKATIGDITLSIENSGVVKFAESYQINGSANGTIKELYVASGDQVSANQPLLRLDDRALTLQLEQAKTSLQIAKLNLANLLQTQVDQINTTTVESLAVITAPKSGTVNYKTEVGTPVNTNSPVMTINIDADDPTNTISIYSKIAGPLAEIYVESGTDVIAGQPLFRVDSNSLYNQVEIQKQNIYNSQLRVDSLELDLEALTLRSPRSGMISELLVDVNQTLSPSSKVATLTSQALVASIEVDELDISYVEIGLPARLYIPGYSEDDLSGNVSYIANKGNVKDGITTYEVQISFDNNPLIREGMSVDVMIILLEATDVLRVPSTAVMSSKDGKIIRVLTPDGMDRKSVVTGISDDMMTEIVSGLEADEIVVTAIIMPGGSTATPGSPGSLTSPGVMIPGITGGPGGGGGGGGMGGGGGGLGTK